MKKYVKKLKKVLLMRIVGWLLLGFVSLIWLYESPNQIIVYIWYSENFPYNYVH